MFTFKSKQSIPEHVQALVARYPQWHINSDGALASVWELDSFVDVQSVLVKLCELCDELNHHPIISFSEQMILIETSTHDARDTVTERDTGFAKRASELLQR